MDRNDSNPGMVERQMDESPMEGASSSDRELSRDGMGGMDRESLQGDSVEREGMQGGEAGREGMQGESVERDSMHGSGSDRESMSGTSSNRDDSMQGSGSPRDGSMSGSSSDGDSLTGRESDRLGVTNTNSNDAEMRVSSREGGYGYDRPADLTVSSDRVEGSSRGTDQGTDRVRNISGTDQGSSGGTTTARDW